MTQNEKAARDLAASIFQKGRESGAVDALDQVRGLDVAGADSAVVGADDGNGMNSSGQFILNPKNSTLKPIQISVANSATLSADVFIFEDFIHPTLTTTAAGNASALLAVFTTVQTAPTWLTSDYRQYRLDLVYLLANPAKLEGLNIASSETGTAPLLNSMQINMITETPFGKRAENIQTVSTFQQTTDFQAAKTTVPLDFPIDLLHYLEFTTVTNTSGGTVSFVCGFSFSRRFEPFRKVWSAPDGAKGGPSMSLNPSLAQIASQVAKREVTVDPAMMGKLQQLALAR